VNVIIDRPLVTNEPGGNRFLAAGQPSPYRDISEVPEALRCFIDSPPPGPDNSEWEAEQKAIADSFSGSINESVAEELERRQGQMIEDAAARNAISLSQSIRQDEFEEQLRREHDEEVAALYESKKSKYGTKDGRRRNVLGSSLVRVYRRP
jgi:hypothetical protein